MGRHLCKVCTKEPIEWCETWCQECWEQYTSNAFWQIVSVVQEKVEVK